MSTTVKCRAKNPATCRVHGSISQVSVIQNPDTAFRNYEQSQKAVDKATNLEELAEAKELVEHDKTAYEATLAGLSDLRSKYWSSYRNDSYADKLKVELDYERALKFRQDSLMASPAYAESQATFNDFVQQNAVKSYVFNSGLEMGDEDVKKFNEIAKLNIPYQTPLAIKLKDGSVIYDAAGNGYNNGKINWEAKLFGAKPSFTNTMDKDSKRPDTISLEHSRVLINTPEIAEIHVLKPGSKDLVNNITNSHETEKPSTATYQRYAVTGKGYRYEMETTRMVEKTTKKGEKFARPNEISSALIGVEIENPEKISVIKL